MAHDGKRGMQAGDCIRGGRYNKFLRTELERMLRKGGSSLVDVAQPPW